METKKSVLLLTIFLFLALLCLRLLHLPADPPETLSASAGPYGDPGGYAYNARNKVLFGTWELDGFNPMYHTLIPHFVTYLIFKLFGVGIVQMNLVPVLFSGLVLILIYWLTVKIYTPFLARIAMCLLGINFIFIMFSRVANRIMPMLFFVVLTLCFFQLGTKRHLWNLLAGVATFLAFITKGVGLYILVACAAGFILYTLIHSEFRQKLTSFGLYLSGIVVAFIPWMVFIHRPYGYVLRSISSINVQFLIPPKSLTKMAEHFWTRPALVFQNMPLISLLAGMTFVILLFRLFHNPRRLALLDWILLFWYAGSYVYFAIIYQRVTRHFVPLVIALSLLVVRFIFEIYTPGPIEKPAKVSPFFVGGLFVFLLFPTSIWVKPLLARLSSSLTRVWTATALLGLTCMGITLVLLLLIRSWPQNLKFSLSDTHKRVLVLMLLLAITIIQGQKYLAWALHPQFKLKQISVDLGSAFDQAVVSGLWAPVLCLENRHRAHESYPAFINDNKDYLRQFSITHVIATDFFGGLEKNYYWRNFPEDMENARLLVKYPIWRGSAFLYDLHPRIEMSTPDNIMEAELFTQPIGMPRFDPESSGQFAVHYKEGTPGFLSIASTGKKLPKGLYRAVFRLKNKAIPSLSSQRIARIDVVSEEQKRVFAVKNLTSDDFPENSTYQEISLTFTLKRPSVMRLRTYSDGIVPLWVDSLRMEQVNQDEDRT